MPGLEPQPDLPAVRLDAGDRCLQSLDGQASAWQREPALLDRDQLYRQAFEFLDSPRYRQAFDLTREPARVRERYGPNRSGPGVSAGPAARRGRRAVGDGVLEPHDSRPGHDADARGRIRLGHAQRHFPVAEGSSAAAPRPQPVGAAGGSGAARPAGTRRWSCAWASSAGRRASRWSRASRATFRAASTGPASTRCCSPAPACAGGAIIGASDRIAAYPTHARRISPCDLAATMFAALGIDPAGHYTTWRIGLSRSARAESFPNCGVEYNSHRFTPAPRNHPDSDTREIATHQPAAVRQSRRVPHGRRQLQGEAFPGGAGCEISNDVPEYEDLGTRSPMP